MKRKILSLVMLSLIMIKAYPQNFVSAIIRGERGISKQFVAIDKTQKLSFNASQVRSLLNLNKNFDLLIQHLLAHERRSHARLKAHKTFCVQHCCTAESPHASDKSAHRCAVRKGSVRGDGRDADREQIQSHPVCGARNRGGVSELGGACHQTGA